MTTTSYLGRIEPFIERMEAGRVIVERFPPYIGIAPESLDHLDLGRYTLTLSIMADNGGATYQVVAAEGGLLIAERTAQAGDVAHV